MDPKDIDIRVADGKLTISAERKETKEEEERDYHRSERYTGSYYREMSLPAAVDPDKVKASSKNGVVKVTLPKREEEVEKSKRIEITSG
jgi:HSP20 family protein